MVCFLPAFSLAQEIVEYSEKAEQFFKEGVTLFSAGSYKEAALVFDNIIADYPSSQRVTAAWVMKGKALCRMDENLDAARTLRTFLAKFPSSTYTSDAELMLGSVYRRIGRVDDAMQSFISAWRRLPLPIPMRLWHEIVSALDSTIDRSVAVATLERMVPESRLAGERAFLWLKIAEKEAARDNIVAAATALDTLSFRYPENSFRDRIALVKSRIAMRSSVRLGALMPLMRSADPSAMKEVGNEVYDGVVFAIEECAKDPSARVKVALETKDTERDPNIAAKGVEEFAANRDIVGIIGPVFTATTAAAAGPATVHGIPLVSPTANGTGIASTGQYVFQANPDYDIRGRAMARYAVEVRGFQVVAVLAPSDTYAKAMAESFVAEATRLGARVIATSWYQRGSSDLKPQLAEIRRAGMSESAEPLISFAGRMKPAELMRFAELGVPVKRIDSLMHKGSVVRVSWLIGPMSKSRIDSLGINVVYDETKLDSLQYPVTGIQAIYLPISSPEEIGVVSSQIVYFNLQTQMLGSGEWNNFLELNANKRYCSGVTFESDTFIDSNSVSYADFLIGFSARMKKRPSRNTLMGYDTARLMLGLIENGATSREALMRALTGVVDYRGLHSKMGFTPGRVNKWISVLRYDSDSIQKVDEVKVDTWADTDRRIESPR